MKTTLLRNWLSCAVAALFINIMPTAPALAAGTPFLIKDITATPASVNAGQLFDAGGGVLYFSANNGISGNELFKYDGATVTLVKDINPGPSSSNPGNFVKMGGFVYFTADDGSIGRELWKTDGTSGGTNFVADINTTGNSSSNPSMLTVLGTNLYFVADDGINGAELWETDGTVVSPVLDINTTVATGANIQYLKAVGTKLFFWANDGINGVRLWCSDGTSAGSSFVTPATFQPASPIYDLNGKALFAATDWYAVTGAEPWISDGTLGGTTRFDVTSGTNNGFHGSEFGVLGSFGYFMGGTMDAGSQNLYRTDGTSAGYFNAVRIPQHFVNTGTNLFFVGNDGLYGVWKTNGSTTSLVAKPNTDPYWNGFNPPSYLTAVGTNLYFVSPDSNVSPTAPYLWVTDGATTTRITALASTPQNLTDISGTLFFTLAGELWKSDGTSGGTVKVAITTSGTAGTNATSALNIKGVTYFVADDGLNGSELWKSDGTAAGTTLVKDIYPGINGSQPGNLTAYNGNLLFSAYDLTNGNSLWISDGTDAGTTTLLTALDQVPQSFAVVNGILYFNASNNYMTGDELWSSDGTVAGTVMVKDINTSYAGSSGPRNLTNVNGSLFFTADDGTNGVELWKSDGTEVGTVIVKDINTSYAGAGSSPAWLINVGGTLFFSADDAINGTELWKSDGTDAGTVMVSDINTTTTGAGSTPKWLKNINGLLYFSADDGLHGYQLFTSDGITATSPTTINMAGNAIDPNYDPMFTEFNGNVYFVANNGASGKELWKSNGTAGGTSQVKDINGIAAESYINNLISSNGALYFTANDGISGAELWTSDGTATGTVLAADILSGSNGSSPTYLVGSGAYLHFFADDGTHGNEPMGVLLDGTPPTDGSLTVTPGDGKVVLTWTAASDANGVASYKLAWGINGFGMLGDCTTGTDIGNVASYSHDVLTNSQTYYYRVCAVDTGGNVSAGATGSATPSFSAVSIIQGSVAFGNQTISSASSPSPVTINNISTGPVTISAVILLGADAGDFAAAGGTCGTVLPYVIPPSSSCDMAVTFLPRAGTVASRAATLSVTSTEFGSPSVFSVLSGAAQATITATAGTGGVISPAGSTLQAAGTNLSYTITPDAGYHIVDVVVDGVTSIGTKTGYTFSKLADNHTINATFAVTVSPYSVPFSESFDAAALPAAWSLKNGGSGDWQFSSSGNATGGAGGFATVGTYTGNAELRMPMLNMSSSIKPTLEFKTDYTGSTDTLSADVSTDNGVNWTNVWNWPGSGPFSATTVTVDITAAVAANKNDVIIRFGYLNGDSTTGDWSVDDVKVYDAFPSLSVTPASPVNMGAIVYGGNQSTVVTIANNGYVPLIVSTASIAAGASDFSVSTTGSGSDCPTLAPTIAAGGSCTVTVIFTPTSVGLKNGALTISSNDPASPANIALSGTGGQATPVITWANPADITYGTALSATQLNATASVPGSFVYTPASGTLFTGSQTLSVTFTPDDATNYTSATKTVTLVVNQATPVITWATPAAVPVGTTLSATQLNASNGSIPGTLSYTPPLGTVMNTVGTQVLSVTFTPTDSTDYTSPAATVNLVVTDKIIPTITWLPPAAITYGTALGSTQLNASSGGVTGSFTYSPVAGTVLAVGNQTLSVTFTPTDTVTYSSTSTNVTLTVNKASATVILWAISQPQTYDGAAKTVTLTTEPSGLTVDVTYNGSATAPSLAGSYAVVATVTDPNYTGTASGTLTIAKATPTITWGNPADIVQGTALSATQLNATASVSGSFVYSPDSGAIPAAGTQTLSVTFTPADSANYAVQTASVSLAVTALPSNQVTTGADGKTTVSITVPVPGANLTLGAGTLLTDSNGNPIIGTLTVSASVMNSTAALPTGLVTAQTPDGKVLSALGNSIDITISAGTSTVKSINPPMIVNLPVSPTFALPGAIVSYYSYDGTTWHLEGTAIVKPDGSVDMTVGHLSVWAIAAFAATVDAIAPVVTSFTVPATSASLAVSGISISATDSVGVTGYMLTESSIAPLASDPGWGAAAQSTYTCSTWGNYTMYAYAKDAAGNISAAKSATVLIGTTDGVVIPALPTDPPKLEPQLTDAHKSLNFAMKVEIPTPTDILHGDVAPLVNGMPQPDGVINLGDTIVILRRVVGL